MCKIEKINVLNSIISVGEYSYTYTMRCPCEKKYILKSCNSIKILMTVFVELIFSFFLLEGEHVRRICS